MKTILVIGAGRSSSTLIKYLLDHSFDNDWQVVVADQSEDLAERKIAGHSRGKSLRFDVFNVAQREKAISESDLVVSMLPASMHYFVAKACLEHGKHMVTASYVSKEIKDLDEQVKSKGLLFLNEIGLDPGVDHMSAMKVIDQLKSEGCRIDSFRSYTGGLVSQKYDNNPWNYKFTWNPRNVVLAGQGSAAQLIVHGKYKYIPYNQLFKRLNRIYVLQSGEFEAYPNRDSLKYRNAYGLDNIPTMVRGTLRRPGFCRAWNVFVQLGATDDTYTLEDSENMTYREFINTFLRYEKDIPVETKLARYLGIQEDSFIMYQLRWLGIFQSQKINLKNATPAQILQQLLEQKWSLDKGDRDMIAMQHIFGYEKNGVSYLTKSSLVVEGTDDDHTAMSKTVGYPVGVATKLIMTGKITTTGVCIPTSKEIYEPVLQELKNYEIQFIEETEEGEFESKD